MRCPNCQTENPPTAKFCLECGNRLVVCPHCGTINLPMAKFCIECGTSLASISTTASENSSLLPVKTERTHDSADQDGSKITFTPPQERLILPIMFSPPPTSPPPPDKLTP